MHEHSPHAILPHSMRRVAAVGFSSANGLVNVAFRLEALT